MRSRIISLAGAALLMSCVADGGIPEQPASGRLPPCPESPNCVSSMETGDKKIEPFAYTGDRETAKSNLATALSTIRGVRIVAEADDRIHATATTLVFRFVDDIDFFFPAGLQIIHVRSASRVGYSDMGVNRKRVEAIRAAFNRQYE